MNWKKRDWTLPGEKRKEVIETVEVEGKTKIMLLNIAVNTVSTSLKNKDRKFPEES